MCRTLTRYLRNQQACYCFRKIVAYQLPYSKEDRGGANVEAETASPFVLAGCYFDTHREHLQKYNLHDNFVYKISLIYTAFI